MTIAKAPYGAPCNNCGLCCRAWVCPAGQAVLGVAGEGPCPAIESTSDGGGVCGLIKSPARYAPIKTMINGEAAMREAFALMVGAGQGCDAETDDEVVAPTTRQRLFAKLKRLSSAQVRHARSMWGI
jgi:hypothetical protein